MVDSGMRSSHGTSGGTIGGTGETGGLLTAVWSGFKDWTPGLSYKMGFYSYRIKVAQTFNYGLNMGPVYRVRLVNI